MDVERCLSSIGSFGLYQKLLSFVLVSYTSFLCAFNYYSQVREFSYRPSRPASLFRSCSSLSRHTRESMRVWSATITHTCFQTLSVR